jgi:hypothetical protein
MKDDIVVKFVARTAAARDAEDEVPGAIPIESASLRID